MRKNRTFKLVGMIVLVVLLAGTVTTGTLASPPGQDEWGVQSVACGDDINCNTGGAAVAIENAGSGNALFVKNSSGSGAIKARGQPAIFGYSDSGTAIRGVSNSKEGVKGKSTSHYGGNFASDYGYDLVLGGFAGGDDGDVWSDPTDTNSDIMMYSNDEIWLYMDHDNNDTSEFTVIDGAGYDLFRVDDADNQSWYGNWRAGAHDIHIRTRDDLFIDLFDLNDGAAPAYFAILDGNDNVLWSVSGKGEAYLGTSLDVAGSTNSLVSTSEGVRRLSAVESPAVWVEDFGTGQLVDGAVVVALDRLFLETVNTGVTYHVFLTPLGDCNGLYVTNKGLASFEVRELAGGASSIEFDYRIVAQRVGYEGMRLDGVEFTGPDGEEGLVEMPKARARPEDTE